MILVIDNYDSFTYNLVRLIGLYRKEILVVRNDRATIDEIERTIDEEIARVVSDGVEEEELQRAKTRAEVEHAHQIENYDGRADLIGMMATYFSDPTLVNRWLEPYAAATAADLQRVASQYLVPENRATSVFVPKT